MFAQLAEILKHADSDDNTRIIVLTGSGDFFTSGNDLNNFNIDDSRFSDVRAMTEFLMETVG